MERKIGEIKQVNGEWYQCVESQDGSCKHCDMNFEGKCPIPIKECTESGRSDKSYVIFKKLEKVGEPLKIHNRLVLRVKADAYNCMRCCFYSKAKCELTIQECERYDCGKGTKFIEINKEDMEEKKENAYIVYKHISPTGKEYVGMTRNIKKRWEGNGCSYTKNSEFRNDIMKYGWDNFQHLIIKDKLSLSEASKLEDELIVDAMNRGVAYNIARGGIGGSHPAWNKGVPLSEEQKAKLIAVNQGKKLSDETKRKIGEAGRGRVFSEETRRKIGDKNRGKKHSKEHTEKWIKSNRWRFRKIEIRRNQELIGVFDSIHGAVRQTGLTQGFIYGILKSPKGKHQGYTIIILD